MKEEKPVGSLLIACGYLLALLGGMIGLLIGSHLLTYDETAEGNKIYRFDRASRRHGKTMITIAAVMIISGLLLKVLIDV